MAVVAKDVLKSYFETGDFPTQGQFSDLIDSLLHVGGSIAISQVTSLEATLNALSAALPIVGQTDEDVAIPIAASGVVREVWLYCASATTVTVRQNGDTDTDYVVDVPAASPVVHMVQQAVIGGDTLDLVGVTALIAYKVYRA